MRREPGRGRFGRALDAFLVLVALHSFAVGFFLLLATRWGARFGGFGEVQPLFFARQAGIFHFVAGTAYLIERFRYGGVTIVLVAKATAVAFLATAALAGEGAWSIPLSAAGDGLMGLAIWWLRRRERAEGG